MGITRRLRSMGRRSRVAMADERGFGLLELVIAGTVVFGAFTSIAYLGTLAMADIGNARLRQSATALANQALEQVRALPRDTIKLGLDNGDLASGDPAIVPSGLDYRFRGERIPHGDNAAISPLVPHRSTKVVDSTSYGVAVYVTYLDDDAATGAFRVTAIASWAPGARATLVRKVEVQTIVDALGCESGSTHPFAAPCQPFLYATATSAPGGVTISAAEGGPALPGAAFDRGVLAVPAQAANLQAEQSSASQTRVTTSGVGYRTASTDLDASLGAVTAFASADSDPSQVRPEYDAATTPPQAAATWGVSGTGASLSFESSAGDTADAKATSIAGTTNLCPDEAAVPQNQPDGQACASGATNQAQLTRARLTVTGLGVADLVTLGAGTNGSAHAKRRLAATGAASCPGPDGCVRAAVRRTLGVVGLGGLPAGLLPSPGFDHLVRIESVTTTVSAEAGVGTAQPSVTRSGTIRYWDGAGYVSLAVGSGASAPLAVPVLSVTDPLTATTVTVSASLATGAAVAPPCAAPCPSAVARADSPLVGELTYRVVVSGVTVVNLRIHVDLGTLMASTTYTAI